MKSLRAVLAVGLLACAEEPEVTPTLLAAGQQSPREIAIDDSDVYWVNDSTTGSDFAIFRIPRAGGIPAMQLSGTTGAALLRVDDRYIYWVSIDGEYIRAEKGINVPATVGYVGLFSSGLAADDSHYYVLGSYSNPDTTGVYVVRNDLGPGGDDEVVLMIDSPGLSGAQAGGIAVDDTSIYCTYVTSDGLPSQLVRLPKGGGDVTVLATSDTGSLFHDVVVAGTSVYWTALGDTGAVYSIPIGGGTFTVLADGEPNPQDIAYGGEYIYWKRVDFDSEFARVRSTGGAAELLYASEQMFGSVGKLAADENGVYWTDPSAGVVMGMELR